MYFLKLISVQKYFNIILILRNGSFFSIRLMRKKYIKSNNTFLSCVFKKLNEVINLKFYSEGESCIKYLHYIKIIWPS